MSLALAAATWVLAASFPQGKLYSRQEADGLLALRAEGTLDACDRKPFLVGTAGWSPRSSTLR